MSSELHRKLQYPTGSRSSRKTSLKREGIAAAWLSKLSRSSVGERNGDWEELAPAGMIKLSIKLRNFSLSQRHHRRGKP